MVFLVASLLNILYSVVWIAGVQFIFAIAKNDKFFAFGGVFQQSILKGMFKLYYMYVYVRT